jgi:Uncharacterized protein conserved in bacteria (DUF2255)
MCGRPSGLESATIGTVVPYGDNVYVRSVKGRDGAWFRGAHVAHRGRIVNSILTPRARSTTIKRLGRTAGTFLDKQRRAGHRSRHRRQ